MFRHCSYANETAFSKCVWEIKDKYNEMPSSKWSVVKSVPGYSNILKKCLLCLHEKFEIVNYPNKEELLNKQSKLISKSHHANKYLLANYKNFNFPRFSAMFGLKQLISSATQTTCSSSSMNDILASFPDTETQKRMTVCSCHVAYTFQSESTLYICLNVKELLARSRCKI